MENASLKLKLQFLAKNMAFYPKATLKSYIRFLKKVDLNY